MWGVKEATIGRMARSSSVQAEHAHVVPHLLQRFCDVVLHLPLGLAHVDAGGVLGRHQVVVHEREDAEFLQQ